MKESLLLACSTLLATACISTGNDAFLRKLPNWEFQQYVNDSAPRTPAKRMAHLYEVCVETHPTYKSCETGLKLFETSAKVPVCTGKHLKEFAIYEGGDELQDYEVEFVKDRTTYMRSNKPELTEADLDFIRVADDSFRLQFNEAGTRRLAKLTERQSQKKQAIVLSWGSKNMVYFFGIDIISGSLVLTEEGLKWSDICQD